MGWYHNNLPWHQNAGANIGSMKELIGSLEEDHDEDIAEVKNTQRLILYRQQIMMEAILLQAEPADARRLLREFNNGRR